MFGFKGVHHVAISVASLEAAKDFYVGKLGFPVADEDHIPASTEGDRVFALKDASCKVLMVKAGNLFLEIFEFENPAPKAQNNRPVCDHGYTHMAFEVEDIDAAYEYLEKAGVRWHHTPVDADEGYLTTYGRDPFGNVIEIQQMLPGQSASFDQLSFAKQ